MALSKSARPVLRNSRSAFSWSAEMLSRSPANTADRQSIFWLKATLSVNNVGWSFFSSKVNIDSKICLVWHFFVPFEREYCPKCNSSGKIKNMFYFRLNKYAKKAKFMILFLEHKIDKETKIG